jgi:hypothetical protein
MSADPVPCQGQPPVAPDLTAAARAERGHGPEGPDAQMARVLRAMTPAQKLETACGLWRLARLMVRAGELRRHPELDEAALERRVAEIMSRGR